MEFPSEVVHHPEPGPCSNQSPQKMEAPSHYSVALGYSQPGETPRNDMSQDVFPEESNKMLHFLKAHRSHICNVQDKISLNKRSLPRTVVREYQPFVLFVQTYDASHKCWDT